MAISGGDSLVPHLLGRYAVYDRIASGGMATVHVGRLRGPVGFARTVAIKRMHGHLAENPEFVSMFHDEARLAARIRHPNVLPTLDIVTEDGELFVVMEYVHGESLSVLVRAARERGMRIPPGVVASIMAGVLHGLHAAHEARGDDGEPLEIVHRDVSPQNVLIGVDGVARVLDFGVAKAVGRLQTTRNGQLKGKMAYMAPEQARGEPIDRRADVYAASAVMWEALTGCRLFEAENDASLLQKVLAGDVAPPSTHAPDVPAALDELTLRGLRPEATQRFATARDMARAIEDAMPAVVASRIGEWVESTAGPALAERARMVEAIERDSALQDTVPAAPYAVPMPADAVTRGGLETEVLTPPSGPAAGSPSLASQPVSLRSRARLGTAAVAVLAVVALGAALRALPRDRVQAAVAAPLDAAGASPDSPAASPGPTASSRGASPVSASPTAVSSAPRVESPPPVQPAPSRRGSPPGGSRTPNRVNVYEHM